MSLSRRRGWYRMPDYPFPLDWEFIPFGVDGPESGETVDEEPECKPECECGEVPTRQVERLERGTGTNVGTVERPWRTQPA